MAQGALYFCPNAHTLKWVGCIFRRGYGFPSTAVDGLNTHTFQSLQELQFYDGLPPSPKIL
jgi:hypothetical protein